MKKVAIVAILALVVIGCVCVAGCTSQDTSNQTTSVDLETIEPAVTVNVPTIEGTFYNVGNIAEIVLPSNGTTGYQWVSSQDDGLEVKDTESQVAESTEITTANGQTLNMVGVGGTQRFWLSSEKAGTYKFTLKYMRSWEGDSSAVATYNGTITFQDNADNALFPNGPSTSFVFDTENINPKAGEYFKIVIPKGNATTGYTWKATGDGLTIYDDYIVDDHEEGMVGVGGTTVFYVTAEKAGTYTLKAEYGRSWEDSPVEAFEINLTFI